MKLCGTPSLVNLIRVELWLDWDFRSVKVWSKRLRECSIKVDSREVSSVFCINVIFYNQRNSVLILGYFVRLIVKFQCTLWDSCLLL